MNHKAKVVSFALIAAWFSADAASQTVDFTVPLKISNLPEKVVWFKVECLLLQADGTVAGNNETDVMVDTNTGKPEQSQALVRVQQNPGSTQPPTRWKCGLYLPNSSIPQWKPPSTNQDADMRPAPGTLLVEEVSGVLPVPAPPIRQAPR
jgi:hypothetical protein